MKMIKLVENFYSIQGEPSSIGKPAYFIRFGGCTLNCNFCDTKYHRNPKNLRELSLLSLIKDIRSCPTNLIVITGGEPLLHKKEIIEIANLLSDYIFEIETNGTVEPLHKDQLGFTNKIRYNCSPKLQSSKNDYYKRFKPDVLRKILEKNSIFKFVVSDMKDWEEVIGMVHYLNIPKNLVYIMPEGKSFIAWKKKAKKLMPLILEQGFSLAPRLHIQLYGKKKGV